MSTANGPSEILNRFLDEQQQIERYIEFVEEVSTIDWNRIDCINDVLAESEAGTLRTREQQHAEPYSDFEYQNLLDDMETVTPQIIEAIPRLRAQRQRMPRVEPTDAGLEYPRLLEQWRDYMYANLPESDSYSVDLINCYLREGTREQFMNEVDSEAFYCSEDQLYEIVHEAANLVPQYRLQKQIEKLEATLRDFEQLRIMCKTSRLETATNILRQGFILLVTAFDAAVFDLVRDGLGRNFIGLISYFCRDDKVNLKDFLSSFRNAGDLTEQVIEKQLGARYVKDVLMILESLKIPLVDKTCGDNFAMLMEVVQRRNIHVHNRGFVDRKYLELDKAGNYRWNLDNLKLGQLASINGYYLAVANRLCGNGVRAIAAWVEGGAGFHSHASPAPTE